MLLIADVGSTKADWVLRHQGRTVASVQTQGFNPVVHPQALLQKITEELAVTLSPQTVPQSIHYYGAGCWDEARKQIIQQRLRQLFPLAQLSITDDLLGAARAACGRQPGIACILGTGSNTCRYDGEQVVDQVTNLGYLLGDEGSGVHLGKTFLQAYFYRELDDELNAAFAAWTPLDKATLLNNLYGSELPNTYLASFTPFLHEHRTHPLIQRMVFRCFATFLDRHVRKYQGHLEVPISFIGSVAFHFRDILLAALHERNLRAGSFIRHPIEALITFHEQTK